MLPIGRATKIDVIDNNLEIEVEFDMGDELGAEVARKVQQGFLSAVSVGFTPKKSILRSELPTDHAAYTKSGGGMYFQENELLEVSVVTIPANAQAVAKGFSIEELALKQMINKMIRTEILSMPDASVTTLKHILNIDETAETFLVTYSKLQEEAEEEELEEIEEELEEEVEEIEEEYTDEEEEEDKTKQLLIHLLTV